MDFDLKEALDYYKKLGAPADQTALVNLLKEIQQAMGGIPAHMISDIAREYGIKEALLLALIRRIPSLRLSEGHLLEICAGPNCGKHTQLAAAAESFAKAAGNVTVKFVPCMRLCGKGPNIRFDGRLYHQATEDLIQKLTEAPQV